MKKISFLLVLALGLMSFTSFPEKENDKTVEDSGYITCCTVFIEFMGQPAGGITRCSPGEGAFARSLACLAAEKAAADHVKEKNREFGTGVL